MTLKYIISQLIRFLKLWLSALGFCCNTPDLYVQFWWSVYADTKTIQRLEHLISNPKLKAPSVIVASFCMWYFRHRSPVDEGLLIREYRQLLKTLSRFTESTVFLLAPDIVAKAHSWPLRGFRACKHLSESLLSRLHETNSNMYLVKSVEEIERRFGFRKNNVIHASKQTNWWNIMTLVNTLCNEYRPSDDQKLRTCCSTNQ